MKRIQDDIEREKMHSSQPSPIAGRMARRAARI
jgi:hypothetical protein